MCLTDDPMEVVLWEARVDEYYSFTASIESSRNRSADGEVLRQQLKKGGQEPVTGK